MRYALEMLVRSNLNFLQASVSDVCLNLNFPPTRLRFVRHKLFISILLSMLENCSRFKED